MDNQMKMLPMVERDEWLHPVADKIEDRHNRYKARMAAIEQQSGTIVDYANGYRYFGWQWDAALDGWWFREWLPEAYDVFIFGDFNSWQRTQLRLDKNRDGVWSIFLPHAMYGHLLTHGSLYKLHIHGKNGWHDRIPAYATRVVQDEHTKNYTAQFWNPEKPYKWKNKKFDISQVGDLLIYEAHVGMSQEEPKVGTYKEFTKKVLPRIKKAGYNAVQLMAIAEQIQNISTKDGNVLLINIHLSTGSISRATIFPSDAEIDPDNHDMRFIADCSSVMPEPFIGLIRSQRGNFAIPPFRAMSYNASITELITMLSIGSRSVTNIL